MALLVRENKRGPKDPRLVPLHGQFIKKDAAMLVITFKGRFLSSSATFWPLVTENPVSPGFEPVHLLNEFFLIFEANQWRVKSEGRHHSQFFI